jgi:alpha-tubulin suppressor-like RCC1 family protein
LKDIQPVCISSPVQIGTDTNWLNVFQGPHAIKTSRTLWGWGSNARYRIGDKTLINRSSPVQIGSDADWDIIAGNLNGESIGVKTNYSIYSWGKNSIYTSDSGRISYRNSPVQVPTSTNWKKIGVQRTNGSEFLSFGIKSDNTLWVWGMSPNGSLGNNTSNVGHDSPVQIGTNVWASASFSGWNGAAVKTDGTLWVWGTNNVTNGQGQLGTPDTTARSSPIQLGSDTNWNDVSADITMVARKNDGSLWAWGSNYHGMLGSPNVTSPILITSDTWSSIGAGVSYSIAIKSNGTLWGWGLNNNGQLGDGTIISRSSPVQIGTLTNWSSVSAGINYVIATKTDGTLWGWGLGTSGQLGDGTVVSKSSPVQIGTDTNWSSSSCGQNHTLAVKTTGTLWSWGLNSSGQLGDGTVVSRSSPVQIGTLTNWSSVSSAGAYSIATISNGTLWAWGLGTSGQLGDGTVVSKSSPVQIGTDTDWLYGFAGSSFTIAIKTNQTLWSWGLGTSGQLGDGTVVSKSSPVQIGTDTDWIFATPRPNGTAFAIKSNGTLWGWGVNSTGQYANYNNVSRSSPIQILSDKTWKSITTTLVTVTTGQHIMAIDSSNNLYTWGSTNAGGQLGQNNVFNYTSNSFTPIQIMSGSYFTSFNSVNGAYGTTVTTAHAAGFAVKSDGTLWAWGRNAQGQLGDETTTNRSSPVQIGTDTNWSDVVSSWRTVYALKTNKTLWAWGNNVYGQIGDGTLVNKSSPVQIGSDIDWESIGCTVNAAIGIKTT